MATKCPRWPNDRQELFKVSPLPGAAFHRSVIILKKGKKYKRSNYYHVLKLFESRIKKKMEKHPRGEMIS